MIARGGSTTRQAAIDRARRNFIQAGLCVHSQWPKAHPTPTAGPTLWYPKLWIDVHREKRSLRDLLGRARDRLTAAGLADARWIAVVVLDLHDRITPRVVVRYADFWRLAAGGADSDFAPLGPLANAPVMMSFTDIVAAVRLHEAPELKHDLTWEPTP